MDFSDKLTIVTVNYNTSDFLEVMLYAFEKLSEKNYPVIICDNGSDEKNVLKLVELQRKYSNVEILFRIQSQAGSIGHAEAIDLLANKVKTPYFMVMDADCCVLRKNWDDVVFGQLKNNVKVFGTPRLLQNGDNLEDFPTVFSTVYDNVAFQELGCSFMPGPGGAAAGEDTGYLISKKFRVKNLSYKNLVAKNTRHYKDGPFGDILCAEYYLDAELKDIFSCHFSRGSSSGKAKYKEGILLRIPFLNKIIRHMNGKRDRKKWIERAYHLLAQVD